MKYLPISLRAFGDEGHPASPPASGAAVGPNTGAWNALPESDPDFQSRVQAIVDRRLGAVYAELAAIRPILALLRQGIGAGGPAASAAPAGAVNPVPEPFPVQGRPSSAPRGSDAAPAARYGGSAAASAAQYGGFTGPRGNDTARRLDAEAEALRGQYPDFNLSRELESNPTFRKLLRSGIDLKTAYEVCHHEEILNHAAAASDERARERVRRNQNRPSEGAAAFSPPAIFGSNPSHWTRDQFRDIDRRVARGERIVL